MPTPVFPVSVDWCPRIPDFWSTTLFYHSVLPPCYTPCDTKTLRITRLRGPLFPRINWHFTHCAGKGLFRCFHFFTQRLVDYDTCYLIPLIQIHGGEPKYMVGNRTHTWWGGHIHGNLAPHQSWPAGWPGHHVLHVASPPCMDSVPHHAFGFPTMYLNQRYQVSSIRINQALRKEMKTSEQTHARAVRKVPTNSWEQGPA